MLHGCSMIMMCVSWVRPEAESVLWTLALETTENTGTHTHTHQYIPIPKSNSHLALVLPQSVGALPSPH